VKNGFLATLLLLASGVASAQSFTIMTTTPSPAREATWLTVQAQVPGCSAATLVSVNGSFIDVTLTPLMISAPCGAGFQVGPLQPGTYVVRFFFPGGEVASPPGNLIVLQSVPAIESRTLVLLAGALIAIAVFALRAPN